MPYYRETCFQRPEKCLYFEIIVYRYCTVTIYTGSYYTVYYTVPRLPVTISRLPLLFLDFRYYFQTSQTFRYYFQTTVTIPRLSVTISRLPLLFLDYLDFPSLFLDFRYYSLTSCYYFQTSQTFRYYFQTSVTIPRLPRLSVTISRLPLLFRDFLSLFLVSLSYFVAPPITVPIFSAIVLDFLTVFLDFLPLPQSSCHFF